jgi:predicted patatin/cPLA2 family phospholipase
VEIDGQNLLDVGIADSIPLRYFESIGYGRNVVILTQPDAYEKKENGLLFLIRLMYRKYPRLVEAMEKRHAVYNETLEYIAQKEKTGDILVLRPETSLPVSRVERKPERLKAVYDIGRAAAQARMSEIRAFLAAE